jgi:hypothetical protein
VNLSVPIVFGIATPLDVTLATYANWSGNTQSPPFLPISADFLHTARLLSVAVLDEHGAAISDGALASASGLDYSPAPVPEPSTIVLLAAGILAIRFKKPRTPGR